MLAVEGKTGRTSGKDAVSKKSRRKRGKQKDKKFKKALTDNPKDTLGKMITDKIPD